MIDPQKARIFYTYGTNHVLITECNSIEHERAILNDGPYKASCGAVFVAWNEFTREEALNALLFKFLDLVIGHRVDAFAVSAQLDKVDGFIAHYNNWLSRCNGMP